MAIRTLPTITVLVQTPCTAETINEIVSELCRRLSRATIPQSNFYPQTSVSAGIQSIQRLKGVLNESTCLLHMPNHYPTPGRYSHPQIEARVLPLGPALAAGNELGVSRGWEGCLIFRLVSLFPSSKIPGF